MQENNSRRWSNPILLPVLDFKSIFPRSELKRKIVVVSTIGKTCSSTGATYMYPMQFDDIFEFCAQQNNKEIEEEDVEPFQIVVRYAPSVGVLYLNFLSGLNTCHLIQLLKKWDAQLIEKGFLQVWSDLKKHCGHGLLLLFCLSHVILIDHPSHIIDTTYLQLLQILSIIRPKFQSAVSCLLSQDLPDDSWAAYGRLCSPRLLFLFKCPTDILNEGDLEVKRARAKKLEHSLEDRLYAAFKKCKLVRNHCNSALFSIAPNDEFVYVDCENRKSKDPCFMTSELLKRIEGPNFKNVNKRHKNIEAKLRENLMTQATSSHWNTKFADENWEAIRSHLLNLRKEPGMKNRYYGFQDSQIWQKKPKASQVPTEDSIPDAFPESSFNKASDLPAGVPWLSSSFAYSKSLFIGGVERLSLGKSQVKSFSSSDESDSDYDVDGLDKIRLGPKAYQRKPKNPHLFRDFLQKHITKAHEEGFYDNMGKFTNVKPFIERPSLESWFVAANFLLSQEDFDGNIADQSSGASLLNSMAGIELQFSTARCKKVIPLALATYQDGLPIHYNSVLHEKQLRKAVAVFIHHARGPHQLKYIQDLKDECEKIWKSGRQTCETLSLFGNTCSRPLHQTVPCDQPSFVHKLESDHWNVIQFLSSCNCGLKQKSRPDPFILKAANSDFYEIIGTECGCDRLEHKTFPVFQPSIHDFKPAIFNNTLPSTPEMTEPINNEGAHVEDSAQSLSLADIGKLWPTDDPDLTGNEVSQQTPLSEQEENLDLNYLSLSQHDKSLVRQASTTEYLPGMVHLESPSGLLPQFSSWSLVCRGPSSLYSHNVGLHEQPGFISGSSFLLPWDVTIKDNEIVTVDNLETGKKSQSIHLPNPKHQGGFKKQQKSSKDSLTVKVFIGVEYECLRGHRFMSCAPGKMLKAVGNSTVKENANKITKGNMPLYLPCPCGNMLAQLMRVHIVTPKAPVNVTLDPKVRPAPKPCPIFVTGEAKPIVLSQSTYWVLRLPYVYASERNVYTMPSRLKKLKYGELVGPTYGVTLTSPSSSS